MLSPEALILCINRSRGRVWIVEAEVTQAPSCNWNFSQMHSDVPLTTDSSLVPAELAVIISWSAPFLSSVYQVFWVTNQTEECFGKMRSIVVLLSDRLVTCAISSCSSRAHAERGLRTTPDNCQPDRSVLRGSIFTSLNNLILWMSGMSGMLCQQVGSIWSGLACSWQPFLGGVPLRQDMPSGVTNHRRCLCD